MIVNISGPSGSGKTTLARALQSGNPLRYRLLVTYTNRAIRVGESNGIHYHFVSADALSDDAEYILRRVRDGMVYAVRKADLQAGSHILLMTFPSRGVVTLRQIGCRVMCFHLELGEEERIKRMRERGDGPEAIKRRLDIDAYETSLSSTRTTLGAHQLFVLDARTPLSDLVNEIEGIVLASPE